MRDLKWWLSGADASARPHPCACHRDEGGERRAPVVTAKRDGVCCGASYRRQPSRIFRYRGPRPRIKPGSCSLTLPFMETA